MKIIINGCAGRMGRAVAEMAQSQGIDVVCGVDRIVPSAFPFPVYETLKQCTETADVVIDFSRPDSLEDLLRFGFEKNIPLILATTGYTAEDKAKIRTAAGKIAVFQSGNMSLGVNILTALCEKTASVLGDACDVEIIETHHNQKVDSPSGTALMLADAINHTQRDALTYTYGRHGTSTKRSKGEIGIHAVRGGSIVGEHEVLFFTPQEKMALTHTAFDRKVFAAGALKAAEFIVNKPAGLYSMQDVIGAQDALMLSVTEGLAYLEISVLGLQEAMTVVKALQELSGDVQIVDLRKDGIQWHLSVSLPQQARYEAEKRFPESRIISDVVCMALKGGALEKIKDAVTRAYSAIEAAAAEIISLQSKQDQLCIYTQEVFNRSLLATLMKEFGI